MFTWARCEAETTRQPLSTPQPPRLYLKREQAPATGDLDEDTGPITAENENPFASVGPGTADNTSNRRVNVNQYQTSLNLRIIARYGITATVGVQTVFQAVMPMAGTAVRANRFLTIRSLAQLNAAKFEGIVPF